MVKQKDNDTPEITFRLSSDSAEALAISMAVPDLIGVIGAPARVARMLWSLGWTIADISRGLNREYSTIRYWKEKGDWEAIPAWQRIEDSLELRYQLLLWRPRKSNADYKELEALGRQLERLAKIQRYNRSGNQIDLNPKLEKRYEKLRNGTAKKPERNVLSDEQISQLRERFLDMMYPHQKIWYQRYDFLRKNQNNPRLKAPLARIRMLLKPRQVGATYYFAHEALIDALETGQNQIFMSASKKQALEFRDVISKAVAEVGGEFKGEDITLGNNNASLLFIGTNSRTAQGRHGHVYMDEYFWIPRFNEFNKVASAMATQKEYRKTYLSTPSSIQHDAYALWTGKNYNEHRATHEQVNIDVSTTAGIKTLLRGKEFGDGIWRQRATLSEVIEMGFDLSDIEQLRRETSPLDFEQLYCCEFIDDQDSAFPLSLLMRAQVDTLETWSDVKPYTQRPCANRPVWLGYDPATGTVSGDKARAVVIEPPAQPGGKFRIIEVIALFGDFVEQAQQLRAVNEKYNVTAMTADTTGIGHNVVKQVRTFYPGVTESKNTVERKITTVNIAHHLFSRGRVEYDVADKEVTNGLLGIKKQITTTGNGMTFASDRNHSGHCDTGWAVITCLSHYQPEHDETLGGSKGFATFF